MDPNLAKVLLLLVPLAIAVLVGLYRRESDKTEIKRVIAEKVFPVAPDYKENKAYLNSLLEQYHERAFYAAYRINLEQSGRRPSVKGDFNGDLYLQSLFSNMTAHAARTGRADLARFLEAAGEYLRADMKKKLKL